MNCREFLIEFEERGSLSETAAFHVTICADCEKTSNQQTQVWLMIDRLKQVAAPNDFDFHVKARIAKAEPSNFQKPRFTPVLRYVLPLSVVASLLGFLVFSSVYLADAPEIVQNKSETTAAVKEVSPVNISLTNQLAFAPSEDDISIAESSVKTEKTPAIAFAAPKNESKPPLKNADSASNRLVKMPRTEFEKGSGGDRLLSSNTSPVFYPDGINPNRTTTSASNAETPKPTSSEQNLSFLLGIEIAVENGRRIVKTVRENSLGARSGVKVGDEIEAIKENSLNIKRGTENVVINLQNDLNR